MENFQTRKGSRDVPPGMGINCSKAYFQFRSGNYTHMESYLSGASFHGFLTPALSLAHGAALITIGNLSRAESVLENGRRLAQLDGDTLFEAALCINLAQLYHDTGKPVVAKTVLDTACALLRADENYGLFMVALRQHALLNLFQGDSDSCETQVMSAIELAKTRGLDQEEPALLYVLGVLFTAKGELKFADHHLSRGIETGSRKRSGQLSRILFQMALVQLLRGNVEASQNAVNQCLKAAKQEANLLARSQGSQYGVDHRGFDRKRKARA